MPYFRTIGMKIIGCDNDKSDKNKLLLMILRIDSTRMNEMF